MRPQYDDSSQCDEALQNKWILSVQRQQQQQKKKKKIDRINSLANVWAQIFDESDDFVLHFTIHFYVSTRRFHLAKCAHVIFLNYTRMKSEDISLFLTQSNVMQGERRTTATNSKLPNANIKIPLISMSERKEGEKLLNRINHKTRVHVLARAHDQKNAKIKATSEFNRLLPITRFIQINNGKRVRPRESLNYHWNGIDRFVEANSKRPFDASDGNNRQIKYIRVFADKANHSFYIC